jgi:hypothetical protein
MKKRRVKGPFLFGAAFLLIIFSLADTAFAAMGCYIKLKNGREIKASHCYEEGNQVFINRFGGYIAVNKSEVVEIASADVPSSAAADPALKDPTAASTTPTKKAPSESTKTEPTEKEKLDKEIADKEKILKLTLNSQMIYCGQAAQASANISPDPHVPKTNQATVSAKTGEAFQKHVESKVQAYKANSSCEYYNNKVPKLDQELEQLKQKRDSL